MSTNKSPKRFAALDAPPMLTSKRKRTAVSYVEVEDDSDHMSEGEDPKLVEQITTIYSEEDEDFSVSRKKTTKAPLKKKAKKTPKPRKQKHFRFLNLPPELRDMIYEMALVDPNNVHVAVTSRVLRQMPYRTRMYGHTMTKFRPALLAVNKQINAEAINYLYGHKFIFTGSAALMGFLFMIGHLNQKRLNVIRIESWSSSRGAKKVANHSGLTMLGGATNLKSLEIGGMRDRRGPGEKAKLFFKDAHLFIQAFGIANGAKDAAVDIVELDRADFPVPYGAKDSLKEEQHQVFQRRLRNFANSN